MKTLSNLQDVSCAIGGLIDAIDVLLNNSEEEGAMNAIFPIIQQARTMTSGLTRSLDAVNAHELDLTDALEDQERQRKRLAEEYDAAQDRGEVATGDRSKDFGVGANNAKLATAADLGLSRDAIHDVEGMLFRIESLARFGMAASDSTSGIDLDHNDSLYELIAELAITAVEKSETAEQTRRKA